jgi:hypothetical protein
MDFDRVKNEAEKLYNQIDEVHCPYLNGKVAFNAKGKEHLKFKAKHKARSQKDQLMRFKLLKYAPEVIKMSRTLQGLSRGKSFERVRSNQRSEIVLMDVTYYEFISVIDDRIRVRIVVKKVADTSPYFWTIIPFWKKNKTDRTSVIHYGDPENA